MKLRLRSIILSILLVGLSWHNESYGQAAPLSEDVTTHIDTFVHGPGADDIDPARAWLIDQVNKKSDAARPAFFAQLNDALLAIMAKPDMTIPGRVRIATFLSDTLAPKSHDPALAGLLSALLNDKNEAVVYAAAKSTSYIAPLALAQPDSQTTKDLMKAIVSSVSNHSAGLVAADIVKSAYNSLNPENAHLSLKSLSPSAFNLLLNTTFDLEQARLDLYQTGVPEYPLADSYPALLFFDSTLWAKMSPQQQVKAVQEVSDLIACIGQRVLQQPKSTDDFIKAVNNAAKFMIALPAFSNSSAKDVLSAVANANPYGNKEAVAKACANVYSALVAIPQFTSLKAPPQLNVAADPGN